MNTPYELILLIASACYWFAEMTRIPQTIGWAFRKPVKPPFVPKPRRLNPFDCPLCLSWWVSLIVFWQMYPVWYAVLYAALCSGCAVLIDKLIKRYA